MQDMPAATLVEQNHTVAGHGDEPFARDELSAIDRRQFWLVLGVLVSVTVLQRFAVPAAGSVVGWGLVVCLALSVWAFFTGMLRPDPARVVLYALALAALLSTLLLKTGSFSLTSIAMLAVIYLPFVGFMEVDTAGYRRILGLFQDVALFVALCGLVQFAIQFAASPKWMFPFDSVLPWPFFIPGFNLRIPIGGEAGLLKSTGLWFLEPSHFSQTLGFAILIELAYFHRWRRLLLLAAAYVVSFSGTGFLLVAALAVPVLARSGRYGVLAAAAAGLALAVLFHELPPFSLFFARLDEFTNPLGSGSMRFLAPYWWLSDFFFPHPDRVLFGFGPGNVEPAIRSADYFIQDSSWLKLLAEYGIWGTLPFLVFYLYTLFFNSPDRMLSFACMFQFLLLGGYLNSFYIQFFYMAIVAWPRLLDRQPSSALSSGELR
jgi:hypothetical protein